MLSMFVAWFPAPAPPPKNPNQVSQLVSAMLRSARPGIASSALIIRLDVPQVLLRSPVAGAEHCDARVIRGQAFRDPQ